MVYVIQCECGKEVSGTDRRRVEAEMWHHAIHDHEDMVRNMTVDQFTEIMNGWDKKFSE
jgi:hypothetical protein